ncbi:hypothetical protein KSAC_15210 [Komagataeibacter saccharivorans]|nr:hypothetical protein KSAC_15210 [Komagataeibacter saccharivorans]
MADYTAVTASCVIRMKPPESGQGIISDLTGQESALEPRKALKFHSPVL